VSWDLGSGSWKLLVSSVQLGWVLFKLIDAIFTAQEKKRRKSCQTVQANKSQQICV